MLASCRFFVMMINWRHDEKEENKKKGKVRKGNKLAGEVGEFVAFSVRTFTSWFISSSHAPATTRRKLGAR